MLVALIALLLLGLLAAAATALWARAMTLAQRRAQSETAFYAAEAGLAEGLQRIFQGDGSFLDGNPVRGELGEGAYEVRVISGSQLPGSTGYTLESTGWARVHPAARRTVRVSVDSAFFRPVLAADDLELVRCNLVLLCLPNLPITFSPEALYGDKLVGGGAAKGVRRGTAPWPRLTYGDLARQVPNPAQRTVLSARNCQISTSGWYELKGCTTLKVTAFWAGVDGHLRVNHLEVQPNSVLVVTGEVDVTTLALVNANGLRGGGIVVAGEGIDVDAIDLAQWGQRAAATLLALDTNTPDCPPEIPGCKYDPSQPQAATDPSNDITVGSFNLVQGPSDFSLVAYAAPMRVPPDNRLPTISIALVGLFASVGQHSLSGALLSAGDLRLWDSALVNVSQWSLSADPTAAGPVFRLAGSLPGSGVLTQIAWSEERGEGHGAGAP